MADLELETFLMETIYSSIQALAKDDYLLDVITEHLADAIAENYDDDNLEKWFRGQLQAIADLYEVDHDAEDYADWVIIDDCKELHDRIRAQIKKFLPSAMAAIDRAECDDWLKAVA